jgi:hypothetical protein
VLAMLANSNWSRLPFNPDYRLRVSTMIYKQSTSLNLLLCKRCGGRCCQGSPGIWIDPQRFFDLFFAGKHLTVEQLTERLPELGLVMWGMSGTPIPAPLSLDSGCAFLTVDGCRLTVAERPCQCLALIPNQKTLEQQQGCQCQTPAESSREVANQRWQNYWLTV